MINTFELYYENTNENIESLKKEIERKELNVFLGKYFLITEFKIHEHFIAVFFTELKLSKEEV